MLKEKGILTLVHSALTARENLASSGGVHPSHSRDETSSRMTRYGPLPVNAVVSNVSRIGGNLESLSIHELSMHLMKSMNVNLGLSGMLKTYNLHRITSR